MTHTMRGIASVMSMLLEAASVSSSSSSAYTVPASGTDGDTTADESDEYDSTDMDLEWDDDKVLSSPSRPRTISQMGCANAVVKAFTRKEAHWCYEGIVYMAEHFQRRFSVTEMRDIPEFTNIFAIRNQKKGVPSTFKETVNQWLTKHGYMVCGQPINGTSNEYEYWVDGVEGRSAVADVDDPEATDAAVEAIAHLQQALGYVKEVQRVVDSRAANKKRVRALRNNYDQATKRIKDLQREQSVLHTALDSFVDTQTALETKLEDTKEQHSKLERQVTELQGDKLLLDSNNHVLTKRVAQLEEESNALAKNVQALKDQNMHEANRLKGKVDQANQHAMEMKFQVQNKDKRIAELEAQLEARSKVVTDLQQRVALFFQGAAA